MSREDRILDFIQHEGRPMTAREITDGLYGRGKQQGILFGKLQQMVRKGLLRKMGASQPYGYEACSNNRGSVPGPVLKEEESASCEPVIRPVQSSSAVGRALHEFFVYAQENRVEMYNEFSFQHELGLFLRGQFSGYRIEFERNVSFFFRSPRTIKKESDIVLYDVSRGERYAIELKMPMNGQYPEEMYRFVEDIKFMEQLKALGFTRTFAVTLVEDRLFFEGGSLSGIYQYFRAAHPLCGTVNKPTGTTPASISLQGNYVIDWKTLEGSRKYYVVEI
jgi:hypothetical protein